MTRHGFTLLHTHTHTRVLNEKFLTIHHTVEMEEFLSVIRMGSDNDVKTTVLEWSWIGGRIL